MRKAMEHDAVLTISDWEFDANGHKVLIGAKQTNLDGHIWPNSRDWQTFIPQEDGSMLERRFHYQVD